MAGKCSDLIGIQAKPCIILFGDKNFGSAVFSGPLEYLKNGDLIFNSIVGPIRVDYATNPSTPSAALTIVKSADPTSYDTVEHTITYHYTVTNSGNVDISAPITVADDNAGTVPIQNSGIP